MEKISLSELEVDIYHEKIPNGLDIYVVPKNNRNGMYATLTTKYGAIHQHFIPRGEKTIEQFPDGIAHFLEHKMFEQPNGEDPFSYFSSRGASANAFTNSIQTTYLFMGVNFFEENLNYLLDYVQTPHFTDENVEKEKGVIEQEIDMYLDRIGSQIWAKLSENLFQKHLIRIPVIGTKESIRKITKEDLYRNYNTFYHPSNMALVVSGNVSPEEVISIVKDNQKNKSFSEPEKIVIRNVKEPDAVSKKYDLVLKKISNSKVTMAYKMPMQLFTDYTIAELRLGLFLYFQLKLGITSVFYEQMKEQELLLESIGISLIETKEHICVAVSFETIHHEQLISLVRRELENREVLEEDFNRKKKVELASFIDLSDNHVSINRMIAGMIAKEGKLSIAGFEEIKKFTYEQFLNFIRKISLEEESVLVFAPENS